LRAGRTEKLIICLCVRTSTYTNGQIFGGSSALLTNTEIQGDEAWKVEFKQNPLFIIYLAQIDARCSGHHNGNCAVKYSLCFLPAGALIPARALN
jgi:hypothetical protein